MTASELQRPTGRSSLGLPALSLLQGGGLRDAGTPLIHAAKGNARMQFESAINCMALNEVSMPRKAMPACNVKHVLKNAICARFQCRERQCPHAIDKGLDLKAIIKVSMPRKAMPACNTVLGKPRGSGAEREIDRNLGHFPAKMPESEKDTFGTSVEKCSEALQYQGLRCPQENVETSPCFGASEIS